MKNSEELIGQTLKIVRNVQPPLGMQQRVLVGVEKRVSSKPQSSLSRILHLEFLSTYSWQTAMLAALFMLTVCASIFSHRDSPKQVTVDTTTARLPSPLVDPGRTPKRDTTIRKTSTGHTSRRVVPVPRNTNEGLLVAVDDLHAPSQPAPELPLTQQEKLLRGIAHHGDPVEIASLDPVVQDSLAADEKLAFDTFFKRTTPTALKRNTETTNESSK